MGNPSYIDSVKHHSRFWRNWQADKNLFGKIGAAIEEKKIFLNILKRYIKDLSKENRKGLKILEEGCGTAINSCILKKEFPHIDFYAIDLSAESVELARKIQGLLGISLVLRLGNAISTEFDSSYFYMIFSEGLMEHFANPDDLLLEQYRILKTGGFLVISVPQKYSLFTIFKKIKMRYKKWEHGWEREYSFGELTLVSARAGFKIVEADGYGFTLEDFFRNGVRKIKNKFFARYLLKPILCISGGIFCPTGILMGKALRKHFCKNLVMVLKK